MHGRSRLLLHGLAYECKSFLNSPKISKSPGCSPSSPSPQSWLVLGNKDCHRGSPCRIFILLKLNKLNPIFFEEPYRKKWPTSRGSVWICVYFFTVDNFWLNFEPARVKSLIGRLEHKIVWSRYDTRCRLPTSRIFDPRKRGKLDWRAKYSLLR